MTARVLKARNPLTGAFDYNLSIPDEREIVAATRRLRTAQPRWRALGINARAEALAAFGAEISRRRGALFSALSADTGRRKIAMQEIDAILSMISRWREDAPPLVGPMTLGHHRYFAKLSVIRVAKANAVFPQR